MVKSYRRQTVQTARTVKYNVHAKSRSQNLNDHFKYLRANGREVIRRLIQKYDGTVTSGFIWLRIGTSRGLLLTR